MLPDIAITQITSDKFRSYETLRKEMPNLKTKESEKGKAFELLHKQIMLFKLWLRGIHHNAHLCICKVIWINMFSIQS